MAIAQETADFPNPSSIDDARLALIASSAALEFDRASRGLSVQFNFARTLAEFLRTSFDMQVEDQRAHLGQLHGSTLYIVGNSLTSSPRTVRDVVAGAMQIVGSIDESTANNSLESTASLRDFCVALANNSMAYREFQSEHRPAGKYRR